MLSIFSSALPILNTGRVQYRDIDYIRKSYERAYEAIHLYMRDRVFYLKNDNIFNQILLKFEDCLELSDGALYEFIDNIGIYRTRSLGIVSDINTGNMFYGKVFNGARELFYIELNPIIDTTFKSKWRYLPSVTIQYTTNKSLHFTHPTFCKKLEEVMVYKIDLQILIRQYKYYKNYCKLNEKEFRTTDFLNNIVFVNMLKSFIDVSLANAILSGEELVFKNDYPFNISDYTNKLKTIYEDVYKDCYDTKYGFDRVFQTIPLLYSSNIWEGLSLRYMYYPKQSAWLMLYSRAKLTELFLKYVGKTSIQNSSSWVNKLRIELRRLDSDRNIFPNQIPKIIKNEYYTSVDEIKKII